MNKTAVSFGSAIKVYPSKNNRTSRSYRPSSFVPQHSNIFLDDDQESADLFDKLVNDEKVKGQNLSCLASFANTTTMQISKRSTLLRDVGNKDNIFSDNQISVKK